MFHNGNHNTSNENLLLVRIKGMKSVGELAKIKQLDCLIGGARGQNPFIERVKC